MLGILSALILGGRCIKEACEKELPAEYHGNWRLKEEDTAKVTRGEMTQREFMRNLSNGKYYAPQNTGLDPTILRMYYGLQANGHMNPNVDYGKYEFIKSLSKEEAHDRMMELYRSM